MLIQAGNRRPQELAPEGENEAVVTKNLLSRRGGDGHGLPCQVDVGDLRFHTAHPDRAEYVIERDSDGSQVRLVVPHTDAVEGVAVDKSHLNLIRTQAKFVKLTCRPD